MLIVLSENLMTKGKEPNGVTIRPVQLWSTGISDHLITAQCSESKVLSLSRYGGCDFCWCCSAWPDKDCCFECSQLPEEWRTLCYFHQGNLTTAECELINHSEVLRWIQKVLAWKRCVCGATKVTTVKTKVFKKWKCNHYGTTSTVAAIFKSNTDTQQRRETDCQGEVRFKGKSLKKWGKYIWPQSWWL